MPTVRFSLSDETARALAQFCKRSTLEDFQRRAVSDAEAGRMVEGIEALGRALAKAGAEPR